MFQLFTVLALLLISSWASAEEGKCPNLETKACSCKTYFDGACIVTCSLASQEDVNQIARIPNLCGGHVHFVLVHSKIEGIPASLWKALLSSKTVDVSIKHSGIQGLVRPGEDIPEASTPGKAVIKIDHTKVAKWEWKQLSKFRPDEEFTLVIDDTNLPELDPSFSTIADGLVHKVTIDSAGLTSVPDRLFEPFFDLQSLSLQNNQLTGVSRDMLARPAGELQFLALNGNLLDSLPDDLFSEMPALQVVYLRDNKIKSLPANLFKAAPGSLQRVDLFNNPWHCDCDLLKNVKSTKTYLLMGKCVSPENLAKKQINWLQNYLNC